MLFFQFPAVNQYQRITFGIADHFGEYVGLTGTTWCNHKYTFSALESFTGILV